MSIKNIPSYIKEEKEEIKEDISKVVQEECFLEFLNELDIMNKKNHESSKSIPPKLKPAHFSPNEISL